MLRIEENIIHITGGTLHIIYTLRICDLLTDIFGVIFYIDNTSDVQTSLQNIIQYFTDAAESYFKVRKKLYSPFEFCKSPENLF